MQISTFQKRLNDAMAVRNITAAELSRRTGISKPRMSQYVNGVYEAKQDALYALSYALSVSPVWLMGYDVPMETENIEKLFQKLKVCDQEKILSLMHEMLKTYD